MTEWGEQSVATCHRDTITRDTITRDTVIARPEGPWRSISARWPRDHGRREGRTVDCHVGLRPPRNDDIEWVARELSVGSEEPESRDDGVGWPSVATCHRDTATRDAIIRDAVIRDTVIARPGGPWRSIGVVRAKPPAATLGQPREAREAACHRDTVTAPAAPRPGTAAAGSARTRSHAGCRS
jgi:hypothetical protein